MQAPSQYIVQGLLSVLQERNMTTSALAKATGKDKKDVKRILSGTLPLTVDDLSAFGAALKLTDADLQQFMPGASLSSAATTASDQFDDTQEKVDESASDETTETSRPQLSISEAKEDVAPEINWTPNPLGNHSEQALRLGFALGCNLFFVANTKTLSNSGIPDTVLKQYGEKIPIRLDADFFHHYRPEYFPEGLEIRLSFDAVYTCFFPWSSFEQITFFVEDAPLEEESSEEPDGKPFLRIVD